MAAPNNPMELTGARRAAQLISGVRRLCASPMNPRTLILLLLPLILFGCAAEPPPKTSPLERLQTMWRLDLSKRDAFKPHKQPLAQQILERDRINVRDISGEEAFKRIDGTLQLSERSLILTGDLATLRKQPKLTEIHNPGTFGSGFSGYLAPDGTLILLWIIPEG